MLESTPIYVPFCNLYSTKMEHKSRVSRRTLLSRIEEAYVVFCLDMSVATSPSIRDVIALTWSARALAAVRLPSTCVSGVWGRCHYLDPSAGSLC